MIAQHFTPRQRSVTRTGSLRIKKRKRIICTRKLPPQRAVSEKSVYQFKLTCDLSPAHVDQGEAIRLVIFQLRYFLDCIVQIVDNFFLNFIRKLYLLWSWHVVTNFIAVFHVCSSYDSALQPMKLVAVSHYSRTQFPKTWRLVAPRGLLGPLCNNLQQVAQHISAGGLTSILDA